MSKFWHLQRHKTNIVNCTQNTFNLLIICSLDLIYHFCNDLMTFSVIFAFDTETAWGWFTVFSDFCFYVNTLVFSQHVWNKWSKFWSFYTYKKPINFIEQQRENLTEFLEQVKRNQDKRWITFACFGGQEKPISCSNEESGINQQSR